MKSTLVILLLHLINYANAQQKQELQFRPYYLVNQVSKDFEELEAIVTNKTKGLAGDERLLSVTELKSSVRFRNDAIPLMFIKIIDDRDPSKFIVLSKAQCIDSNFKKFYHRCY
jgi:hypothetical protein